MSVHFVLSMVAMSLLLIAVSANVSYPLPYSTLHWSTVHHAASNDTIDDYAAVSIPVTMYPPAADLSVVNQLKQDIFFYTDSEYWAPVNIKANTATTDITLRLPLRCTRYWFSYSAESGIEFGAGVWPSSLAPDEMINITVDANLTASLQKALPLYTLTMSDVVTQTNSTTLPVLAAFDVATRNVTSDDERTWRNFSLIFTFPKPTHSFRFVLTSIQRLGRTVTVILPNNGSNVTPQPVMTLPFFHTNVVKSGSPNAVNSIVAGDTLVVSGGFIVTDADRFECAFVSAAATVFSIATSAQSSEQLTCTVPLFITRVMSAGDEVLVRLVYMPTDAAMVQPYFMTDFATQPPTFVLADPTAPQLATDWKVWAVIGTLSVIGFIMFLAVCTGIKRKIIRSRAQSVHQRSAHLQQNDYRALDEALLQDAILSSLS